MFQENSMTFSDDEMIVRLWDKENVQDIMSRHAFYRGGGQRRREINELWVQEKEHRQTASMGNNFGFYVGLDEVARHYVSDYEDYLYESMKPYQEANPDKAYTSRDLGIGLMSWHASNTPVVFISLDGKYARYLGYDVGHECQGRPDGSCSAQFTAGLEFAELVKENGVWKIWHTLEEHDHTMEVGQDYSKLPIARDAENDVYMKTEFSNPTVEKLVYDQLYGWETLYFDMPAPFYTYVESEGYGPNGKIGKSFYERMI